MKKILLIIIVILPIYGFCQNWQWAKQAGGDLSPESYDYGRVITDGANYYLYGTFAGTMRLQTDTFNSLGNSDFFIIKYDASGNEIWAKAFGGNNVGNYYESMSGVYDSITNSLLFSGYFQGVMTLDTIVLNATVYANNFIAKMDTNGNFLWAKKAWLRNNYNLSLEDSPPALSVRSDGLIYLSATVYDTASFDGHSVLPGGCMAKIDSNGNCFYVRHLFDHTVSGQGGPLIKFMNTDIIMYGIFKQTFNIDTATLISNGDYDMFISRADSNGNIKWIKQYGYSSTDAITQIAIDNLNYIYVAAGFIDSTSIDGNVFYSNIPDILLFKLDEDGNFKWARQTNASGNAAFVNDIISDGNGYCYLTGAFSSSATFGTYYISTSKTEDMFLARYDSSGNCLGVRHFGFAVGNNVVTDNSGYAVCAGMMADTVTIGSNTFISKGPNDIFVAKIDAFTGMEGLKNIVANNQLIIYANPNAGKCNIVVPDDFLHEKNLTLSIFDNSGKMIQQKTLVMNDGKIKLDLEAEAKGIYNVSLTNGKKMYSGKIVFE